jgi:hypothetical protein
MTEVAARYRDVSFTPDTGLGSRVYEYKPCDEILVS